MIRESLGYVAMCEMNKRLSARFSFWPVVMQLIQKHNRHELTAGGMSYIINMQEIRDNTSTRFNPSHLGSYWGFFAFLPNLDGRF